MGVGDVVARNDIQYERYDVIHPTELARVLAQVPGLGTPRDYGPTSHFAVPGHDDEITLAAPANGPPVPSLVDYPVQNPTPIVRGEAVGHSLLLSGDGEGLVDAADVGLVDGAGVIRYSASLPSPAKLRAAATPGSVLVITDQNRLRARRWTSVRDNLGFTEQSGGADAPLTTDLGDARLDVFPGERASAVTTTDDIGVQQVRASSYGNTITYTAEDRPAMAFDGDVSTAWRAAAFGDAIGQRIRVVLDHPITTDHVRLLQPTNRGRDRFITQVALSFDGGHVTKAALGPASRTLRGPGQTVNFGRRTFRTFEVRVTQVNDKRPNLFGQANAVGFAEIGLRADGASHDVRVREVEQMPTDLVDALGAATADHPIVLVMRRDAVRPVPPRAQPELSIARAFTLSEPREFLLAGNATISPDASVAAIRSALGADPAVEVSSSGFMAGCLDCRPDAAIDGDAQTAWQTPFNTVRGQWAQYSVAKSISFDHLDLQVIADGRHSVPTRVTLTVDGIRRELAVPPVPDGAAPNTTRTVRLPFPRVFGRVIRLTIDDVREVRAQRFATAATVVAPAGIAELGVPGLRAAALPAELDSGCRRDLLAIDGRPVAVRVTGTPAAASAVMGLSVSPCGEGLRLGAGRHTITTARGKDAGFSLDRLVLASGTANEPVQLADGRISAIGPSAPAVPLVRVAHDGETKVRVHVSNATQPFWLVLGQSQSPGWQARIKGGKNLGGSELVDGYANGWLVTPTSKSFDVTMEWTPQRQVWAALWLSLVGVLLCLALVVFTWRRRRVVVARPLDDAVAIDWRASESLRGRARWIAIAASAALGAIVVTPWVGVVAGAAAWALTAKARLRAIVLIVPAMLLLLVGFYIAVQQHRYAYPSVFEWPTLFPHARTPAWIAVILLAADAVIDIVRRRTANPPEASLDTASGSSNDAS
jgi:hypothetical protein